MPITRFVFFAIALSWFISPARLSAKKLQRSHDDCLKLVPGDWGPNFGEEWKQHEAVYWGCRLGASVETIQQWQQFSSGMIQDLIPVTVGNEQIVLIESMEGSAHCFEISALRKNQKGWESVWSPPSNPESMDYCTLTCPPVRVKAFGKNLTLEIPQTSDPKEDQTFSCKHFRWRRETYHWDGHTYQPAKVNSHSKSAQTGPVVAVLFLCDFTAPGQVAEKKSEPKLDNYPVTETWQGHAASLQVTSRSEHQFRTQLSKAAQKPPDFAGHYRFAIWGCGTQCVGGALIDLETGKVFQPPPAPKKSGEEHWIFCTSWDKARGAKYSVNSRLFILHCGRDVHYFVWENKTFWKIVDTSGRKPK